MRASLTRASPSEHSPEVLSAARTRWLYELTDERGEGCRDIYVLGSLTPKSERLAVASQQTRAINLVHALSVEKRLKKGDKLCVIGGGAAGLTAAAYAISKGVLVTVLESRVGLWNLRGCRTRWLHPNLFRFWPDPRWQCTATDFPVMNWYAGYACDVGELLWSKYQSFEALQSRNRVLKFPQFQPALEIKVEPRGDDWRVSWRPHVDPAIKLDRRQDDFNAVIIAVGFGTEARIRDAEASTYWLDDTLERERPDCSDVRYLISGTGDGGLTDLLRIRISDFRHHHLREALLSLEYCRAEIHATFEEIRNAAQADRKYDSTPRWLELAKTYPSDLLLRRSRKYTRAVLTNNGKSALGSNAWSISKFLAATLLVADGDYTEYRPGPVVWVPCVQSSRLAQMHPKGFHVTFPDTRSEHFNAIVVRHGPESLPDDKGGLLPAADAAMLEFGFQRRWIKAARKKWARSIDDGWVTDVLIAPTKSVEAGRRSRRAVVLPALGGRTVIGMLSRLVSCVDPEEFADTPGEHALEFEGPLVRDRAAHALATVSDRIESFSPGMTEDDAGWRLGAELDRTDAITVISAADTSLKALWRNPNTQRLELERTWVLPRPDWLEPRTLLRYTRVARHWGEWRLRYKKVSGLRVSVPRRAAFQNRLWAQLDRIPAAREAFTRDSLLAVVDLCAWRTRVAVCRRGGVRASRLARELGAKYLVISIANTIHEL